MKLNELIKEYHRKLLRIYPPQEIQSIVYLVMETYLKIARTEITLHKNNEVHEALQSALLDILTELETGKPIQYIIGETSFFGLNFKVTADVLIPRQETEELVDWIIRDFKIAPGKLKILDIGTGSGCIAISLAKELKNTSVVGMDNATMALEVAKYNAQKNHAPVKLMKMDILNYQPLTESFDVIVSNPPYVTNKEKSQMHRNVLEFEPSSALFVPDKDPLLFYHAIISFSRQHLEKNGKLYLEINEHYGDEIIHILKKSSFNDVELRKDINGKDRMIKAGYGNG